MADKVASLPPLRDVIAAHELRAHKSLGQHFLLDLNLTGRIAKSAANLDKGTIIEIGPGPGGLTRALLLAGAKNIIAVEKDRRCIAALQDLITAANGRLTVLEADALEFSTATLGEPPRQIVANLPYNIASPLLIQWLKAIAENPAHLSAMTIMVQKEVAMRLIAKPRSKDYGRLSVLTQAICQVDCLFDINPRAFTPPPKVDSTVVQLIPKEKMPDFPLTILEKLTAAAFGQRRKMLRQSLKSILPDTEKTIAALRLPPTARAEELSIEDFFTIARRLNRPGANA
ncbi:MAG: 16S rRNA (adenine(1518)-N(6)/adenine(1519)-N(6))-dimethyltransferase RsmA [Dongiaceae bacterium]